MKRSSIHLVIVALMVATATPAMGQAYTGSILFEAAGPGGVATNISTEDAFGGQIVGASYSGAITQHAELLTAAGAVDLTPAELTDATALGTNGVQQVGYANTSSGAGHAMLWTGTAASAVDLNPTNLSGITYSEALGTNGIQQVGRGNAAGLNYANGDALLWAGTAASAVDLSTNTILYEDSEAVATDGTNQVGYGDYSFGNAPHALLWSGTAASLVDLNTNLNGITETYAYGVGGTQQVGQGKSIVNSDVVFQHALLWTGTATSAVDLNPTGYTASGAVATNGNTQIGWANNGANEDAMLWTGTAQSAVDLTPLLPSTVSWQGSPSTVTWGTSYAYSVDTSGNVYGVAQGLVDNAYELDFAVQWSPVPEPATCAILLVAGTGILMQRRRKHFA